LSLYLVIPAKLALYKAIRDQGTSNVESAKRLSKGAVRRLFDPGHVLKIEKIDAQ
jgi:hypothetical protein